jgi:2-C-methyl-D-erythritol 4-phosphate cytidylyltransferase
LAQAHEEISSDVTDDAAMVEMIGGIVKIFPGSDENLKLTTVSDITFAEAILQQRLLQDMSSN